MKGAACKRLRLCCCVCVSPEIIDKKCLIHTVLIIKEGRRTLSVGKSHANILISSHSTLFCDTLAAGEVAGTLPAPGLSGRADRILFVLSLSRSTCQTLPTSEFDLTKVFRYILQDDVEVDGAVHGLVQFDVTEM